MHKRFYFYFLALTLLVLGITGINSHMVGIHMQEYNAIFKSQEHTMLVQKEVAIAQEYANNLARLADLAAQRAHELDEQLIKVRQAFMNLLNETQRRDNVAQFQLEMVNGYVGQLAQYIEDNKLPVPAPDPNVFVAPSFNIEVVPAPPFETPPLDVQGPE